MLHNGSLMISPCSGINTETTKKWEPEAVTQLLCDLKDRQNAEQAEDERIAEVLTRVKIPVGKVVVVDGEGMRIING